MSKARKKAPIERKLYFSDIIIHDSLKHIEDSAKCWCSPQVMQVCPEIDDDEDAPAGLDCEPSCWRCHGESIVPAIEDDGDAVILHNYL